MEWDKQLQQLSERLSYMRDIFPDKHAKICLCSAFSWTNYGRVLRAERSRTRTKA